MKQLNLSAGPRIRDPGLPEALFPEEAGVAGPARTAAGGGVVAGAREREVEAEARRSTDEFPLGKCEERRADAEPIALDSRFRPEVGHPLEGLEKFGTAIRIAGVVE